LPVVPMKGESLAVFPRRARFERTLFAEGCYLVPKADGKVIVGATERGGDFTEWVTTDAIRCLTSKAVRLVPDLAESTFIRAWASVRPSSPDGLPYVGRMGHYRNLFVATSHFRNGILLSPITGQRIADLIAGEEVPDIEPFSPNRLLSDDSSQQLPTFLPGEGGEGHSHPITWARSGAARGGSHRLPAVGTPGSGEKDRCGGAKPKNIGEAGA